MSDNANAVTPQDLKLQLERQHLLITWKDGLESDFPLAFLRKNCPCATCRTDRENTSSNPFQILKQDPAEIRVVNAELVGHYAIQLFWSDGHQSGIFDYRLLRDMADQLPKN